MSDFQQSLMGVFGKRPPQPPKPEPAPEPAPEAAPTPEQSLRVAAEAQKIWNNTAPANPEAPGPGPAAPGGGTVGAMGVGGPWGKPSG